MATLTQQQRVINKGTAAALARVKDRMETPLILHHGLDGQRLSSVLRQIQNGLPMGVSLVDAPHADADALAKSEAHIQRLVEEKRELQKQLAALQAQIDETRGQIPMADAKEEWVTLSKAAKMLHKSYATLWRAKADGRLTVKVIGGKSKDQVLCLASTFRGKVGG